MISLSVNRIYSDQHALAERTLLLKKSHNVIAGSQKDLPGNRNIPHMHSSLNTFLESTTDHGTDSPRYWATEISLVSLSTGISPVNVRFLTVLAIIVMENSNILRTSDINQEGLEMLPTVSTQGG